MTTCKCNKLCWCLFPVGTSRKVHANMHHSCHPMRMHPVFVCCQYSAPLAHPPSLQTVTFTLSARFSSQSPSEKALKPPVLLGLSGGLAGGLVGPCPLLEFTGLDAEGTCAAALKARARCWGCFLGVRLGCMAMQRFGQKQQHIREAEKGEGRMENAIRHAACNAHMIAANFS